VERLGFQPEMQLSGPSKVPRAPPIREPPTGRAPSTLEKASDFEAALGARVTLMSHTWTATFRRSHGALSIALLIEVPISMQISSKLAVFSLGFRSYFGGHKE
jgi:hypothetical protein